MKEKPDKRGNEEIEKKGIKERWRGSKGWRKERRESNWKKR